MPPDALTRLDVVARQLPFGVLDVESANDAFARWRQSGAEEDQRDVDLWTYCYVQRYFYVRFLRERGAASDLDDCISKTLERVRRRYEEIDPQTFSSYVSVACRHTLLNHRRGRRDSTELPESLTADASSSPTTALDLQLIARVIEAVLRLLPENVARVGHLRLLERKEYKEIASVTGLPLPTVRTYASRAVAALREDARIRALYFDDLLPPGALPEPSHPLREDE